MKDPRRVVFIFFALIILLVVYLSRQQRGSMIEETISEDQTDSSAVTEQPESALTENLWQSHQFAEVGLTFSTPPEMEVTGELLDERTFTLYVQRGAYPEAEYYQLYGLYNLDPSYDPVSVDIKGTTDGLEPTSVSEGTISGYKSVSGQNKGERNRFVTYVFTDKGILTLSTSQPTPENEALTAEILKTMEIK